MKTTLDIPNDLYRQAKAQAALENLKIKDLVTEGLRLALEHRRNPQKAPSPLEVLQEIRRQPLHPPSEVTRMIDEARRERLEGWNRDDLAS